MAKLRNTMGATTQTEAHTAQPVISPQAATTSGNPRASPGSSDLWDL
jgi:hypothetical protein